MLNIGNYEKMLADSLAQMHRIVELLEEIKEILNVD